MSPTSPQLTKSERREAARAEALALKKKQESADRRARLITLSILGVVLVVLVGLIAWVFLRQHEQDAAAKVENIPLAQVETVPSTARDDGGILISKGGFAGGTENADVPTVGVHYDYMCPGCGQFEAANESVLQGYVADGTANVVLYPVAILDRAAQGTAYSTRAASAFAWVADRAPGQAFAFHSALYANQPQENTPGLTNEQIADLARKAGVPADVADGIATGKARTTFSQWVYSLTNTITNDPGLVDPSRGTFTTPAITVDDVRQEGAWNDPATLTGFVADAAK